MAGCLDWPDALAAHFGAVSRLFPLSGGLRSDKAEWDDRVEGLYGHGANLAMWSVRFRKRENRENRGEWEDLKSCRMYTVPERKGGK